jgi:hypothetical protein
VENTGFKNIGVFAIGNISRYFQNYYSCYGDSGFELCFQVGEQMNASNTYEAKGCK